MLDSGLLRYQKEPTTTLHGHPIHGPIKLAACVKESISKAAFHNSTLTLVDISQGKGIEVVLGTVDQASTNFVRIRQEVT